MLLTCPSCSARYEAPDSAFPPEGRVVECSACGTRWLQPGPAAQPAEAAATAERPAGRPEIPGLSEAAAALAELRGGEARTEKSEAPEAAPEAEPEDEAPAEGPLVTRADLARARLGEPEAESEPAEEEQVETSAVEEAPPAPPVAPPPPRPALRELPDAARLNADLRSEAFVEDPPRRGGFWLGLILALILGGAATAAYVARDRIAEAAPEAAPMLDGYAEAVDGARLATEELAGDAVEAGQGLVDAARDAISGFLELKPPQVDEPPAEAEQSEG